MSLPVAIVGASGFSGATLVALLAQHPLVSIQFLGSRSHHLAPIQNLYPSLQNLSQRLNLPLLQNNDSLFENAHRFHAVFCCLPHNETPDIILKLLAINPLLRIIDLSAALRIHDPEVYQRYYHTTLERSLTDKAVYGLSEIYRKEIAQHQLIANPGCYTTTTLLPLIPLIKQRVIEPTDILIDAKSGISGAGRKAEIDFSFCMVHQNFKAYACEGHRHEPEILQELDRACQNGTGHHTTPSIMFTPHLVPISRGILANLYVHAKSSNQIWETLHQHYLNESFVKVLPLGEIPSTLHANYSNQCVIGVVKRSVGSRHLIVSATDNLIKGAAGQAIQNLNIMMGFDETSGLVDITAVPL